MALFNPNPETAQDAHQNAMFYAHQSLAHARSQEHMEQSMKRANMWANLARSWPESQTMVVVDDYSAWQTRELDRILNGADTVASSEPAETSMEASASLPGDPSSCWVDPAVWDAVRALAVLYVRGSLAKQVKLYTKDIENCRDLMIRLHPENWGATASVESIPDA